MAIADIIAAFAAAALAGTGVGGGGLLVIYLTALAGVPQFEAQAMNLVFFISAALAALPYHAKKRRLNTRLILFCALLGSLGTLAGGAVRKYISEGLMRKLFGVFLVSTGALSLLRLKSKRGGKTAKKRQNTAQNGRNKKKGCFFHFFVV